MTGKNQLLLVCILLCISCSTAYRSTTLHYSGYRIEKNIPVDSGMISMLQPFTSVVNTTMNRVIGRAADTYASKLPESALGNFMADAYLEMAAKKYERKVDMALMNPGGIRSYIAKGDITIGRIVELMPFDNQLVLQELKGSILKQLLDKTAADGGWPVSAGTRMVIKDKKATEVYINGKPLDENAVYVVANSDYIANGGSDCDMLRAAPQIKNGYLLRDALLEYISELTQQGRLVDPKIENRVTHGN